MTERKSLELPVDSLIILESAKMNVDVNCAQENESKDSYLILESVKMEVSVNCAQENNLKSSGKDSHLILETAKMDVDVNFAQELRTDILPHTLPATITGTPPPPDTWCSPLAVDEEQINNGSQAAPNDDKSDTKSGVHPFFGIAKKQLEGTGKGKKRVVNSLDYGYGEKKRHKPNEESTILVGINKSSINTRKLNEQVNAGVFEPSSKKMQNFRAKILELDPKAEFSPTNIRAVRHFKCGEEKIMKEPYNIANFKTHVQSCKGSKKSRKLPGGSMSTIDSMMNTWVKKPCILRPTGTTPCPGLTADNDNRIPIYFERTNTAGGGAVKLETVSSRLFPGIPFGNLKDEQKLEVRTAQRLSQKWRNERDLGKIYATSCSKEARFDTGNSKSQPCVQCIEILKDAAFKRLVSMPVPTPENTKFTPRIWRETKDEVLLLEKYGTLGLKPIIKAYKNVSCNFKLQLLPDMIIIMCQLNSRIPTNLVYSMQEESLMVNLKMKPYLQDLLTQW
jgi:hypothetical protein